MGRKPSLKDKIMGCLGCLKEILIGIFTFDDARMELFKMLFIETAKGNFEVVEIRECPKAKEGGRNE